MPQLPADQRQDSRRRFVRHGLSASSLLGVGILVVVFAQAGGAAPASKATGFHEGCSNPTVAPALMAAPFGASKPKTVTVTRTKTTTRTTTRTATKEKVVCLTRTVTRAGTTATIVTLVTSTPPPIVSTVTATENPDAVTDTVTVTETPDPVTSITTTTTTMTSRSSTGGGGGGGGCIIAC